MTTSCFELLRTRADNFGIFVLMILENVFPPGAARGYPRSRGVACRAKQDERLCRCGIIATVGTVVGNLFRGYGVPLAIGVERGNATRRKDRSLGVSDPRILLTPLNGTNFTKAPRYLPQQL